VNTLPEDKSGPAAEAPPSPLLFRVFDCERPLEAPARHSLADVDAVALGRGARSFERRIVDGKRRLAIAIDDPRVSTSHARLTQVFGRWTLEDLGSRNGTLVNGARVDRALLADGDLIELGRSFFLYRAQVATPIGEPADLEERATPTISPPLRRQLALLATVARSPVPILIAGESGTGKEVTALSIHALSERPGPFVALNCGALPETLIESELFGSRRGAFSGAVEDRPGLVRAADRGTLFLDEIGDLKPSSQAAFLRVLESHEVVPVGGTRPIKVDLRVVAATHCDLDALMAAGKFRRDLHARLAGMALTLPPLRERREDVGLLIARLLERHAPERAGTCSFSSKAARALLRHDWPLNVRELEKCLATAVVLAGGGRIELEHLPPSLRAPAAAGASEPPASEAPPAALSDEDAQRHRTLIDLLRRHDGNVTEVARSLGRSRMQVHRWLRRLQIDPKGYR